MKKFKLLDTVALLNPVSIERLSLVEPDYTSIKSLPSGQVGTIVEVYEEAEEYHYLVEFADTQGREYAMATLKADELLLLQYELTVA
ncbi:DUF4926 domain-containing protein [Brasilonema octagenarum UFV-E1]|uniref:DUF4926 domain-containing protein n=2 Tax=Brasilonema TaxID=383614 RepID=A0A856M8Z4_9CYAN|nr:MULTISPECIES: DUF4926 domain-containing protein [Brasilonema]NMF63507.1 DUF4926 domain-containing protein [Brasilonema octagenarum UFV-OR1]QDL06850.1 DUF4926 domain-containing protein [Brasilonema sennae CENA114]QDL13214.1 DUF4926 domain-containing protein [Brasilonema octagenarum UFV-E1]